MVRIVRFHKTGGPEVLRLDDIPEDSPLDGQVRLKVKAIGLNRAEVMLREGVYHEQPVFPSRIGYEAAGIIDAVGAGVESLKEGDRVATVPSLLLSQTRQGVYGESAIVPAQAAVKYPETLSFAEGAALWMQYLTAYGALVYYGRMTSDDIVLVTAASSSVGVAAIQVARATGATVIASTRTAEKQGLIRDLGANHVIVLERDDLPSRIKEITGGSGVRLIFDPIAGPFLTTLCDVIAPHGIIYEYGALHPEATPYPLMPMLAKSITITGYQVLDFALNEKDIWFVLKLT